MAFPTVTGTNTTNGTAAVTSAAVNLPATVNAGDTLIVFHRSAVSGAHAYPGGWTEFFDIGTPDQTSAAWKKADGTEGGTQITVTQASGKFASVAYSIGNAADPTVTAPQASTGTSGNSANPDPGTVTPTGGADDYLWLTFMGVEGEQTSPPTYPTNYTESQTAADSGAGGAITTNVRVAGAKRTDLNAASENPGTFTISAADDWRAFTIAVHPSTGGTIHNGAAAFVGSAITTVVGALVLAGSMAVSGAATLAASAGIVLPGESAISSTATVAASAGIVLPGESSLAGSATVAADGTVEGAAITGEAALSASATTAQAATMVWGGESAIAASAVVSPTGAAVYSAEFAASVSASVAANGSIATNGETHDGEASLVAETTISTVVSLGADRRFCYGTHYTVATMPPISACQPGSWIFVTDAAVGARFKVNDGEGWKNVA